MELRVCRQTSHQTCTLILGQGGIRSHTWVGREEAPSGEFLTTMSMAAWAQGHIQETCSCCCRARTAELTASAATHRNRPSLWPRRRHGPLLQGPHAIAGATKSFRLVSHRHIHT
eukprot:1142312-Pelagomonas_calceolata.AAC.5